MGFENEFWKVQITNGKYNVMLQLRAMYYSVNGYEQLNVIHTSYFWKVFGQA